MSPSPAADVMRGSSPTEEAKLLSEEEKEERSSLVKSLESWDLFSDPRDQNGMVICDRYGSVKMKVKDDDQFPLPAESRALSASVAILRSEGEAAGGFLCADWTPSVSSP